MKTVIDSMVYLMVFVSLLITMSGVQKAGFVIRVLNQTNRMVEIPLLCDGTVKVSLIARGDTVEVTPIINLSSYISASHVNIDSIEVDGKYALKYESIFSEAKIKWCIRSNISKRDFEKYNVLIVNSPKGSAVMTRIANGEFAIRRFEFFSNTTGK